MKTTLCACRMILGVDFMDGFSNRKFVYILKMKKIDSNNPLEGKTLEAILTELVEKIGWEKMGQAVRIKCFTEDPSIKSSLTFLRKTPWARAKVEELYLRKVFKN